MQVIVILPICIHGEPGGGVPDTARPIPLAEPNLSGREAEYLLDCVKTNYVSSVGPYVTRFEEAVARSCGAPGAVSTASGTSGLHLALVCAGVRHGDLVLLPSFTFIASANAIAHCGAMPWLIDIERESWNMDPALVEAELARSTERRGEDLVHKPSGRRVGALMPVYTLGTPADMDRIGELARRYGLPVVADAAAALGASYKGRALAGLTDLTVFSFNGNKTVTRRVAAAAWCRPTRRCSAAPSTSPRRRATARSTCTTPSATTTG
jgi:dTDP-4-amino-4,6-dideoxygalactose transaminase